MKIIAATLLLALLYISPASANSEVVRWKKNTDASLDFILTYREKNVTFIDFFHKNLGEYQTKLKSLKFLSDDKAKEKFEKLTIGYSENLFELHSIAELQNPITELTGTKIWNAKNAWDSNWEKKFKEWLEENADAHFFKRYNIATDCADVAFAFRWIFSRINSLPAGNHLGGTGQLFTNESMKSAWRQLPTNSIWYKDKRFLAALDYVLDNTYTHSLMSDSYPIAINKNSLIGGAYYLDLFNSESGHTEFIQSVGLSDSDPEPIQLLASTVPRAVRDIWKYGFDKNYNYLAPGEVSFLRFRWIKKINGSWTMVAPEQMPDYSTEQFDSNFQGNYRSLTQAVMHRLIPNWNPNYREFMSGKVALLFARISARASIVEDGFRYCTRTHRCEEGSPGWENWSTPSRDSAIGDLISRVLEIYWDSRCDSICKNEFDSKLSSTAVTVKNRKLSLSEVIRIWDYYNYSSDPNDSIEERWGLEE